MPKNQREPFADKVSRRFWRLKAEALLDKASRRAGMHDFGDPPLEPALSILVESLDQEADLHPMGRFLMWNQLVELLTTRLQLIEAWKRDPQRDATPITRPLIITGMPRSGSTFLHELLAIDSTNRAPRAWEVMFPLPPRKSSTADGSDPRIRQTAARLWLYRRLVPGVDKVNPLRAQSTQECNTIHSYSFMSEEFLGMCWLPSYENWLRTTDFSPAYVWERRFLQHMHTPGDARRWVLKSPDHAYSLTALLSVFPDAMIVQTHREPMDVLTSCVQIAEVLHKLFGRPAGRDARAWREVRVLADAMDGLLRFRESHPELTDRFVDVNYSDLIANPIATVNHIYNRWGTPLSASATDAMRQFISRRSRYPNRRSIFDLGGLGSSLGEELRRFDRYCTRFGFQTLP